MICRDEPGPYHRDTVNRVEPPETGLKHTCLTSPLLEELTSERGSEVGRHVREAGVVPLERDRDRVGRTISVLGNDEVSLAFTR